METEWKWDEPSARSFYLEQLKLVRIEADKLADETRVTERYVLGACGGIYTFVLAQWPHLKDGHYLLILLIPFFLAIWGGWRSRALYKRILQCADFVKGAEVSLPIANWTGWENWLNSPWRNEHVIATSAKAIWVTLIAGTGLIPLGATVTWVCSRHMLPQLVQQLCRC